MPENKGGMIALLTLMNKGLPRHYRGLSSDVVDNGNCTRVEKSNGDEIYCMDNQEVWMGDEENQQWINQSNGSVVAWT